MVMSHDIQRIKILVPRLFAKGQAQATSNGLHSEDIAFRSVQRNDGKQVVHVPSFLQLINMQYDFYRIFCTLDGK